MSPPAVCETCGRTVIIPSPPCANCPHGEYGHDISGNGQRARCLHFGPAGRCPCDRFTPAGAGDG